MPASYYALIVLVLAMVAAGFIGAGAAMNSAIFFGALAGAVLTGALATIIRLLAVIAKQLGADIHPRKKTTVEEALRRARRELHADSR